MSRLRLIIAAEIAFVIVLSLILIFYPQWSPIVAAILIALAALFAVTLMAGDSTLRKIFRSAGACELCRTR